MTAGIIDADTPPRPLLPADLWSTNEGIYLGLTPEGWTDQRRPLAGKEAAPSIGRGYDFRTPWTPDGGSHLFVGEGHIAVVGPQGSGKTRKLLLPNLYKLRDWSAVVIDTKGGLCALTALERAKTPNHRVYVIDPFKVIETEYPHLYRANPRLFKSCGFNPVAALDPKSPSFIDDAKAMAMALISSDDARDPYWPMAAQALAKGLAMVLRSCASTSRGARIHSRPSVTISASSLRSSRN
jgi:type IV secretory pathway TraG/TraD family ATPase VirD4